MKLFTWVKSLFGKPVDPTPMDRALKVLEENGFTVEGFEKDMEATRGSGFLYFPPSATTRAEFQEARALAAQK